MKLENQVCSLEQGRKLKELGITAEPLFSHFIFHETKYRGYSEDILQTVNFGKFVDAPALYPAFTVAEMGVMCVNQIATFRSTPDGKWEWENRYDGEGNGFYKNEAAARADCLIYLLEEKLLTAEEANKRLYSH